MIWVWIRLTRPIKWIFGWIMLSMNAGMEKSPTLLPVGQEPELLNNNPALANPIEYRVNGNNLSNHGTASLDTDWTHLFSTGLTYNNSFYDYDNSGAMVLGGALIQPGGNAGASLAGLLDRIEESVSLDLKWHLQPETTLYLGYQLSWVNYTGNEPIAVVPFMTPSFNGIYHSSDRDSISHYAYIGLEHQFTPNLSGNVRVGGSYIDNYSDPLGCLNFIVPVCGSVIAIHLHSGQLCAGRVHAGQQRIGSGAAEQQLDKLRNTTKIPSFTPTSITSSRRS